MIRLVGLHIGDSSGRFEAFLNIFAISVGLGLGLGRH